MNTKGCPKIGFEGRYKFLQVQPRVFEKGTATGSNPMRSGYVCGHFVLENVIQIPPPRIYVRFIKICVVDSLNEYTIFVLFISTKKSER